jgi:hemoglobin
MKTLKILMLFIFSILLFSCAEGKKENHEEEAHEQEVVAEKPAELSLYQRLGEDEGISALVDDIVEIHMQNDIIKDVFLPLKDDPAHFESFKQNVKDFFSAGTGGGAEYKGKDMPTAHANLNITSDQFIAATDDIMLAMSNHNMDDQTKKDVLYILYSLKGVVIGL